MPLPIRLIHCTLALYACIWIAPVYAADLEVEVRGIKLRKGEIRAALFDNARDFAAMSRYARRSPPAAKSAPASLHAKRTFPDPPLQTIIAPANANTVRLHFADLEPGEYAVALFHDRNSDGKLDAMIDRRTLEPWGASNDPRPTKGPVTWEEAKFILPAEGKTIAIQLH